MPLFGPALFQHSSLFYVGLGLVFGSWALIAHTSFGLAVRALGEDPVAADKAGVDVGRTRYLGVLYAGGMAGVAGAFLAIAAVPEVEAALSGVDVLVNNAGIMSYSTLEKMPVELWDRMMAVNLRGVFFCSRLVISGMKAKGWGRIINLGSQLAQKGARQLVHYGASKAGVIGFTRSLARELIGFGITVNAICPGPIDTELSRTNPPEWRAELIRQIPIGRYGEVEEIAPTDVPLASDEGSFYVGAALRPNGGELMACPIDARTSARLQASDVIRRSSMFSRLE